MNGRKFVVVVKDTHDKKYFALEGMVEIVSLFGDPAKLSISQAMMVTPFGERLVTTVWMFPYKDGKVTTEKVMAVGSTILNPTDTFSYKQAVINALTAAGNSYLAQSKNTYGVDSPASRFIQRYGFDNLRINAAISRWARSEGRRLFNDALGTLGDMDNNPRIQRLNARLNDPTETHNYLDRTSIYSF